MSKSGEVWGVKWIRVEEELPPLNRLVLISPGDFDSVEVGERRGVDGNFGEDWWWYNRFGRYMCNTSGPLMVRVWALFPEAPKGV